jgi:hypothetical protein
MNPFIQQSITPILPAQMHNGTAVSRGIIPFFAQDVVFTLDQLEKLNQRDPNEVLNGRLDLRHVGFFGVSLGGIIVGEACWIDRRLRAYLILDAPMSASLVRDGLSQLSMWITRNAQILKNENWSQFGIDQHQTTMRSVYNELTSAEYFVQVQGMFHINLTDVPSSSPLLSWLGASGPIGGKRAHDILNAYSVAFFDKYLGGPQSNFLDGPAKQFPEVQFESRTKN